MGPRTVHPHKRGGNGLALSAPCGACLHGLAAGRGQHHMLSSDVRLVVVLAWEWAAAAWKGGLRSCRIVAGAAVGCPAAGCGSRVQYHTPHSPITYYYCSSQQEVAGRSRRAGQQYMFVVQFFMHACAAVARLTPRDCAGRGGGTGAQGRSWGCACACRVISGDRLLRGGWAKGAGGAFGPSGGRQATGRRWRATHAAPLSTGS